LLRLSIAEPPVQQEGPQPPEKPPAEPEEKLPPLLLQLNAEIFLLTSLDPQLGQTVSCTLAPIRCNSEHVSWQV
jgi:hypothetical protein